MTKIIYIDGSVVRKDILVFEGDTLNIGAVIKNASSVVIDITDYKFSWLAARDHTAPYTVALTDEDGITITNPLDGSLEASVKVSLDNGFNSDRMMYQFHMTDLTGTTTTIAFGNIVMVPSFRSPHSVEPEPEPEP